ncbi:MAG: metallophosphoesterase, partial [Trueperella sp.]|nr:metallophosphoesterase [Trueperella sp.]
MSKWKVALSGTAAVALAAALLPSLAVAAEPQADEISIVTLSDTHVLARDLIADTPEYDKVLNSDRKLITESEAIFNAAVERVIKEQPSVVLMPGDLTKDGEQESHKIVAEGIAKIKAALPETEVYVINGNHDVNNSLGVSYSNVPATRTAPKDFKDIYQAVYQDDSVVEHFESPGSEPGPDTYGELSYVARPAPGYTVIAVDSGIYLPEHNTAGAVAPELQKWIIKQAEEAKARGDVVVAFGHHAWVPHFSMQPKVLSMYIVEDYENVVPPMVDAGVDYIFTGHSHSNDVAEMTTAAGNRLVDLETGSLVTYPNPMRHVTVSRNTTNGTDVTSTLTGEVWMEDTALTNITFAEPDGTSKTIDNLTDYAKNSPHNKLTAELISNFALSFLNGYAADIKAAGGIEKFLDELKPMGMGGAEIKAFATDYLQQALAGIDTNTLMDGQLKFIDFHPEAAAYVVEGAFQGIDRAVANGKLDPEVEAAIDTFVTKVMATKVSAGSTKDLADFATEVYQMNLRGDENERAADMPEWFKNAKADAQDTTLIKKVAQSALDNIYPVLLALTEYFQMDEVTNIGSYDTTNKQTLPYREGTNPLLTFNDVPGKVKVSLITIDFNKAMPKLVNDSGWVKPTMAGTVDNLTKALGVGIVSTNFVLKTALKPMIMGDPNAKDDQGNPAPKPSIFDEGQMAGAGTTFVRDVVNSMSSDENNTPDSNFTYETKTVLPKSAITLGEAVLTDDQVMVTATVAAAENVAGAAHDNRTALGKVQFFVNGEKAGEPVALAADGTAQLQLARAAVPADAQVTAQYLSDSISDAISTSDISAAVAVAAPETPV